MKLFEKTLTKQTLYSGRILDLELQEVELADGTRAPRELIRHAPAVGVVARRPDGTFVFVRQFRKAVEQVMLEIVAGICEPGEAPATTAARELREETGYTAVRLVELGSVFATPGYVDERITLFFAELTATADATQHDHDERLETVTLNRVEVERLLDTGKIQDAKTLAAWLLFTRQISPLNT
ncbi:MAG: NUDIX hydrolase [Verrucomicrobia bacterium]|nr:MAG: NUDIX hydrolase [Verrucomicrobiota bacterium]